MAKKLTNKFKLPEALVRAIQNDSYDAGDSDFSATELLKPSWQRMLMKHHADELTEDASDRIWSLIGQSVHTILERAGGNEIKEKRYFTDFGQYKVSAQIDNLHEENGVLSDYKVTTAWGFKADQPIKPEYEQQLNVQAEILRRNGFSVHTLNIVGILRDWSKLEANRNEGYPQSQVIIQDVPLWTSEKATAFINMRIAALLDPRPCSESEMWQRPTTYAVLKKGQKRAMRVFNSLETAEAYWGQEEDAYEIEKRPGVRTRCESYCSVSSFCDVYKKYLKDKNE